MGSLFGVGDPGRSRVFALHGEKLGWFGHDPDIVRCEGD